MTAETRLLVNPGLRKGGERAAEVLRATQFDAVFLDLPLSLQSAVEEFIAGAARWAHLSGLLTTLEGERRDLKPVLEALREANTRGAQISTYCYLGDEVAQGEREFAAEVAALTLRAAATGKVDVAEWRAAIMRYVEFNAAAAEEAAEILASLAGERNACLVGLNWRRLSLGLRSRGHRVRAELTVSPYVMKPLEVLARKLAMGAEVPDNEVKALVLDHVEYVSSFVLTSRDLDEAYERWLVRLALRGRASDFTDAAQ